jgi:hypothetical protein
MAWLVLTSEFQENKDRNIVEHLPHAHLGCNLTSEFQENKDRNIVEHLPHAHLRRNSVKAKIANQSHRHAGELVQFKYFANQVECARMTQIHWFAYFVQRSRCVHLYPARNHDAWQLMVFYVIIATVADEYGLSHTTPLPPRQ